MNFLDMASYAQDIRRARIDAGFDPATELLQQIINVAEETGEFVGAARRYLGHARRSGSIDEVGQELADVIISAFVAAELLDLDLELEVQNKLTIIFTRGWRD